MLSEKALEVKKYLEDFNQSKRKLRNLKDELKELLELGALPRVSDGNMPGAKGGYKLRRPTDQITLKSVIELIDGPIAISRCVDTTESSTAGTSPRVTTVIRPSEVSVTRNLSKRCRS